MTVTPLAEHQIIAIDEHITLREATPSDRGIFFAVFVSTRDDLSLALASWAEAQRRSFLDMQFAAQQQHYRNFFPDARYWVVLANCEPVGRLIVAESATSVRLVDMALLPQARNHGIGTALLTHVVARANALTLPVRLSVMESNPAKRLYARLGFHEVGVADAGGMYAEMERPFVAR